MKKHNMPQEVKEYFAKGRRTIKKVNANDNYTLAITFDNDEVRIYDMSDTVNKGVFQILKNKDKFKEVYIDDSGVISWDKDSSVDSKTVWENKLNICPDSCYIYSKPL